MTHNHFNKIKNMPGVGPLIRFHATWILGGSMKESWFFISDVAF